MQILVLLFGLQMASALEVTFGPEFTMSSQQMLDAQSYFYNASPSVRNRDYLNPHISRGIESLRAHYKANLRLFRFQGFFTRLGVIRKKYVRVDGRWSFEFSADPGVIEYNLSPMTLEQTRTYQNELQEIVFDTPKLFGLEPQLFAGGGHLNIGLQAFQNNRLLLHNFIVDFINHNELSMGIFGYDTHNAISSWQIPGHLGRLKEGLGALLDTEKKLSPEFIRSVEFLFSSPDGDKYFDLWEDEDGLSRGGYTALRPKASEGTSNAMRLEIRAVRPQQSIDQYLRQIELLQARINYLETLEHPLELQIKVPLLTGATGESIDPEFKYNPPVDPQQALKAFHQYVAESGLNWEDHQDYIWPMWISGGELERFNAGLACDQLLQ